MPILDQLLNRQQQGQPQQQQGVGQDDMLSKLAILSELMKFSRPQQQPQPVPQMEAQQPIEFESSTDVLSKLVNMGNAEKQEARLGRQEGRAIQQEGREAEEFETDKTTKADTQAAAREIYGLPQEQKGDWQSWQGIINKYPGADVNTFRQGFESNVSSLVESQREQAESQREQSEFASELEIKKEKNRIERIKAMRSGKESKLSETKKLRLKSKFASRDKKQEILDSGIGENMQLLTPAQIDKIENDIRQLDYEIGTVETPDPAGMYNPKKIRSLLTNQLKFTLSGAGYKPEKIQQLIKSKCNEFDNTEDVKEYIKELKAEVVEKKRRIAEETARTVKAEKERVTAVKERKKETIGDQGTGFDKWGGLKATQRLHEKLKEKRERYIGR
jgi:hypothetical protein